MYGSTCKVVLGTMYCLPRTREGLSTHCPHEQHPSKDLQELIASFQRFLGINNTHPKTNRLCICGLLVFFCGAIPPRKIFVNVQKPFNCVRTVRQYPQGHPLTRGVCWGALAHRASFFWPFITYTNCNPKLLSRREAPQVGQSGLQTFLTTRGATPKCGSP